MRCVSRNATNTMVRNYVDIIFRWHPHGARRQSQNVLSRRVVFPVPERTRQMDFLEAKCRST